MKFLQDLQKKQFIEQFNDSLKRTLESSLPEKLSDRDWLF